jgi:uncharacterized protein YjeT (DUF2065 family)
MVPSPSHWEPAPPAGYVVSFMRLHKSDFNIPASRFMRGLCHHYGVELHNFASNAISLAASFVAVCEGILGIPTHWNLWRFTCSRASSTPLSRGRRGLAGPSVLVA